MCRYVVEAITDHAVDEKVGNGIYKGEYGGSLDYNREICSSRSSGRVSKRNQTGLWSLKIT
jgi:hypothetical protein